MLTSQISGILCYSFKWLVDEVASQGINTERHIIFCHRANDMTGLFHLFSACLGDKQYVSLTTNLPNDCNRLFAMYHQKTDPDIQETVRKSFGTIDGVVRVLFCTIAFGMGIDVKGVHNVIHYGPARDIDDYLQESGGRNPDVQSHALLLNVKGSSRGSHISTGMRQYIKDNTKCKRVQLLEEFQNNPRPLAVLHNCCSFCANKCKCHCACISVCSCSPCEKSQSLAEIKITRTYNRWEFDSDEEDGALSQLDIFKDSETSSTASSDSGQDLYTRTPVLFSSSSDEN